MRRPRIACLAPVIGIGLQIGTGWILLSTSVGPGAKTEEGSWKVAVGKKDKPV